MENKKNLRLPLAAKILILVLAVVIVASITIGTVSYRIASKNLTKTVYAQIEAISNGLCKQIDGINEKHFTSIRFLSELDFMKDESVSLEEKSVHLRGIVTALGDKYENVAFYDKNGDCITADGRVVNTKDRIYWTEAMAGHEYVSDPTYSPVIDAILQQYSVPVYNANKKTIGAIVLLIKGNALYDTISEIDLGGGMHPSVINNKTRVTVANANENTDENSSNSTISDDSELGIVLNNIFAGKEGISDFMDPNLNMKIIAAYQRIPRTDWTLFSVAPHDYYFQGLHSMQNWLTFVILATIIISVLAVFITIHYLIKPLKTVKGAILTIASGHADLTQRIPDTSNDEIGDVVKGFNMFVDKLHGIVMNLKNSKSSLTSADEDLQASSQDASASITEIISNIESVNNQILNQASSVQETAGAVNEISSNIESLERMIDNQSSCVSEASAAVEQMIGNINSVNTSVGKMISSFDVLQHNSELGIQTQNNANERIVKIEQQSKMLQDANVAIANIASQTNLLAMNAAIEAAHAGEAGKGFAVVADEIRKLSETSTKQSKTIGTELKNIQETIKDVVKVSSDTNAAFSTISQSIADTSQIIEQIKAAMEEQQTGSKQIIDSLKVMNNSTSEVKTASEEMTEGNKAILSEIEKLQRATDTIKDSIQEMHTGAKRINETGAALGVISNQVGENIKHIGDEIDLFTV